MKDSTRSKVKHLLSLDQRFRDNDKHLILKVWESDGFILTMDQRKVFMELPSADVIVRRRREFSYEYPPSPSVLDHRYKNFKLMTDEYSKQGWLSKLLKRRGITS